MFGSFTEPFSCAMQCVFKLKCADVSLVCFCVLQLKLGLANRIRVCARAWVRVCLGLGLGLSLGYIMFALSVTMYAVHRYYIHGGCVYRSCHVIFHSYRWIVGHTPYRILSMVLGYGYGYDLG